MRITPSVVLPDGRLVEQLVDGKESYYVISGDTSWQRAESLEGYAPLSAENNLITHRVVCFPSAVGEYTDTKELSASVQEFIHRYVDLPPFIESLATSYVLFSWIHDAFNELPYLRVRGDYGSGKTRFLQTIGALSYKAIFASGASSASSLFRIIDLIQGTLILDESDFHASDERSAITKILNNGNAKGFPVLRSEQTPQREYNPRAFRVFSPKVIASRHPFADRALESRCLTHEMAGGKLREDIPINLPDSFEIEAQELRNMLLSYRFRNFQKVQTLEPDRLLEPRLAQVFTPLLSTIEDSKLRKKLSLMAEDMNLAMKKERSWDLSSLVLGAVLAAQEKGVHPLSVKAITEVFNEKHAREFGEEFTARKIGGILRKSLELPLVRRNGVFILPVESYPRIAGLAERSGLDAA